MIQPKLKVTITKTAQGDADYVQIMSGDMFATNIVLIAYEIEVDDMREKPKGEKKRKTK
jgi:hypothetical protein